MKLLQSDGWKVTVATAGRSVGGAAVAIPPNQGALWRGTGEGGSDGMTVAFGVGCDNGIVLHYTGVIDQATGSLTGERPDGVTWKSTGNMRCIGERTRCRRPSAIHAQKEGTRFRVPSRGRQRLC